MAETLRDLTNSARRTDIGTRSEKATTTAIVGLATTPVMDAGEKVINNDVNELAKLTKGAGQTLEAIKQSSLLARKLKASDTLVNYTVAMKKVNQYYDEKLANGEALTVQDYQDKKDWQQSVYNAITQDAVDVGDETDQIFKDGFLTPATKSLYDQRSKDTKSQFEVHKRNVRDDVRDTMDAMGTNLTQEVTEAQIERLKIIGEEDAAGKVYDAVAVSMNNEWEKILAEPLTSEGWKPYLVDGVATIDSYKKRYSDMYGNFISFGEDGNFVTKSGVTDAASRAMMRSFNSGKSILASQANKLKIDSTISDAYADMVKSDIGHTSAEWGEAIKKMQIQYTQTAPYRTDVQKNSDMQTIISATQEMLKASTLEGIVASLLPTKDSNGNIFPPKKTPKDILANKYVTEAKNVDLGNGIQITASPIPISRDTINKYLDTNLVNAFNDASNAGRSEDLIKIVTLSNDARNGGMVLPKIEKAFNTLTDNFENGAARLMPINETVNKVKAIAEFNKGANAFDDGSFISESVALQVAAIAKELDADDTKTPAQKRAKINDFLAAKQSTYGREVNAGVNRVYAAMEAEFSTGKTGDSLAGDWFVSGETFIPTSSMNVLLSQYMKQTSDNDIRNIDDVKEFANKHMVVIDDFTFVGIGKSTTLFNNTTLKSSDYPAALANAFMIKSRAIAERKGVDIDSNSIPDIRERDNSKFTFMQVKSTTPNKDGHYGITTIVSVYDDTSGEFIYSVNLNKDEIRQARVKPSAIDNVINIMKGDFELPEKDKGK